MWIKDWCKVIVREGILLAELFNYSKGIPVLLYHNTADDELTPHIPNIQSIEFEKQIQYLYSNGYKTLTIREIIQVLNGEIAMPRKSVIITFDDGYKSNNAAFQILSKYNYSGICFLATAFIGKEYDYMPFFLDKPSISFETATVKHQRFAFLSEDDIRQASKNGIQFCPHTHNHIEITRFSESVISCELKKSKEVTEKITGNDYRCFSYPVGMYDDRAKRIVTDEGFDIAFSVDPGLITSKTDRMILPRTNVPRGIRNFRLLLTDKYVYYERISRLVNSRKR